MSGGKIIYTVLLNLYKLRNWRVVEAEDDEGRVCKQLMIPMLQNGIKFNRKGDPSMSLMVVSPMIARNVAVGSIIPYITKDALAEMEEKGLSFTTGRNDTQRAPAVGFLFPPDSEQKGKKRQ